MVLPDQTMPMDADGIKATIDEADKPTVFFASRSDAELLQPGQDSGVYLIAIADSPGNAINVDHGEWAGVSHHCFLDGEYDVEDITSLGSSFHSYFGDYFGIESADAIREAVDGLDGRARHIVVACDAGQSRSAAVAWWIAKAHGYVIHQDTPDANETVMAILERERTLCHAIRQAEVPSYEDLDWVGKAKAWLKTWFGPKKT